MCGDRSENLAGQENTTADTLAAAASTVSAPPPTRPIVESTITVTKKPPKFRFIPLRTCCHRAPIRFDRPRRPAAPSEEPKSESPAKRKVPEDDERAAGGGSRFVRETLVVSDGSVTFNFTLDTHEVGRSDDPSKRKKVTFADGDESEEVARKRKEAADPDYIWYQPRSNSPPWLRL